MDANERGRGTVSDRIYVRDLEIPCIIGTNSWERKNRQTIVLNLEMTVDLRPPGRSDNLEHTLNYVDLKDELVDTIGNSSYFLIEKLAQRTAEICLSRETVRFVKVTVDKPGASPGRAAWRLRFAGGGTERVMAAGLRSL